MLDSIHQTTLQLFLKLHFWHVNAKIVQGRSRNFGKGVHMYKGVGVRFADFILFILNIR